MATSSSKISKPEKDSVVDESSTEIDNGTVSESSSVDKSSSDSSSSGVSSSSSYNEGSSNKNEESNEVTSQLVGKHFIIAPTKYDGIDITKAMDDGKAPVNTVHDGHLEGEFINTDEARMTYVMGATSHVEHYTAKNGTLKVGPFIYKIPYTLNNGTIDVPLWEEKTHDGHTITMQMKLD